MLFSPRLFGQVMREDIVSSKTFYPREHEAIKMCVEIAGSDKFIVM